MRLSRYVRFVEDGDRSIAVSLLSRTVMRVSPQVRRLIESFDGASPAAVPAEAKAFVVALLEGLFLVPDDFDEFGHIKSLHRAARSDDETLALVIAPTAACNLNCHYCFERKSDTGLDAEAITRLSVFASRELDCRNGLHVQWFGGEPLAALPVLREVSRRLMAVAAAQAKPYSAEIITNGVLLTQDVAVDLAAHGVKAAQITFDGDRRLHDRVRIGSGREGTFDVICINAAAAAAHMAVTARVHVAPYSADSVGRLLDELAAGGLQNQLARIYFAPIFDYKAGASPETTFRADARRFLSAEAFAAVQASLVAKAMALGFKVADPLDVSYGLCTAVRDSAVVVNPDGSLAKCYMDVGDPAEAVGDLGAGIDGERVSKWTQYDFALDPECAACVYAPVCLGACPKQRMARSDKTMACTPLRYNFDVMMRQFFGSVGRV